MTYRLLLSAERPAPDEPSAQETYRALVEDRGEARIRIKEVLEGLLTDPGKVQAQSRSYQPGSWWATDVVMPGDSVWWVIWRMENESLVRVRWIGPSPREPGALAWTSG